MLKVQVFRGGFLGHLLPSVQKKKKVHVAPPSERSRSELASTALTLVFVIHQHTEKRNIYARKEEEKHFTFTIMFPLHHPFTAILFTSYLLLSTFLFLLPSPFIRFSDLYSNPN